MKYFEKDPTGRKASDPGAKLDQGKLRAGIVLGNFSRALTEVCRVGDYGIEKYLACGWVEVPDGEVRYADALTRHYLKMWQEETDPDTGISHLAHLAWNALAIIELKKRNSRG